MARSRCLQAFLDFVLRRLHCFSGDALVRSTDLTVVALIKLPGWIFAEEGDKCVPFGDTCEALGLVFNLGLSAKAPYLLQTRSPEFLSCALSWTKCWKSNTCAQRQHSTSVGGCNLQILRSLARQARGACVF